MLFTLTDTSIRIATRSATLVLLVPSPATASEADCVGLSVSLTKALSTLGLKYLKSLNEQKTARCMCWVNEENRFLSLSLPFYVLKYNNFILFLSINFLSLFFLRYYSHIM